MVDYIIDAEILQPVFDLIDEKVSTQDERGTVKRSIMDVLNAPKGLGSIDINDVRDLFLEGCAIHAFDVSVDGIKEGRMFQMMAQINKNVKHLEPYNHALVFFFSPENHPLLMEELQPFSEWIESVPDDFLIIWGMATQSTQDIRAIVLLQ